MKDFKLRQPVMFKTDFEQYGKVVDKKLCPHRCVMLYVVEFHNEHGETVQADFTASELHAS